MLKLLGTLNEAQTRWFVAREAMMLGRGGVRKMCELTGLSKSTVMKGIKELKAEKELGIGERVRQPEEKARGASLREVTRKPKQIITVDLKKCYACLTCVVECAYARLGLSENTPMTIGVLSAARVSVEAVGDLAVPIRCMQCEDAPCMTVCPTGALYRKSPDEPVLIDKDLCIGCKSCILACPIGAISLDVEGKSVQKCDMCIERLEKGELPVCVASCPMEAIQLTTLDEIATKAREMGASLLVEASKVKQKEQDKSPGSF